MMNWNIIKEDTNIFGGKYFLVECIAEIKDNQTGEIRMIDTQERLSEGDDYPGVFNWGENNYSCDCNRRIFFKRSKNELTNRILDKINQFGMESLSKAEKQYLDNKSQDVVDDELEDIVSIDSGYEFNDTVDDYDVKFIYNETEEWDEDPVEYKHTGKFYIDGEEYFDAIYEQEKRLKETTDEQED